MADWVSRPSANEDGLPFGTPLDNSRYARDLLPPAQSRTRVEGCAPYLWEQGLPPFEWDSLDSSLTYPT